MVQITGRNKAVTFLPDSERPSTERKHTIKDWYTRKRLFKARGYKRQDEKKSQDRDAVLRRERRQQKTTACYMRNVDVMGNKFQ